MARLDDLVRQAVEAYLSRSQMSERKLGAFAVGDPSMVPRFMAGGSIRLDKADQLLCYMGQRRSAPASSARPRHSCRTPASETAGSGPMPPGPPCS